MGVTPVAGWFIMESLFKKWMIYIGVHHGYLHFRKPFGDIPRWTSLGRRVNTYAPGGLALLNAADAFVAAPTPAAPSLRGSAVAQARVDCTAA